MDARQQEAMDKIRDEMAAHAGDGAIQAIGQLMTEQLQANPEAADAALSKGKSLMGAYKALEDYAKKNRAGKSCVYVPPGKAMEIVAGYYGLDADTMAREERETKAHAEPDGLDLDALLGL